MYKIFSATLVFLALISCSDSGSNQSPSSAAVTPGTVTITANNTTNLQLTAASTVNLAWTYTNVKEPNCTVKGSDGTLYTYTNKAATVTVSTPLSYQISCTGNDNAIVSATAYVTFPSTTANSTATGQVSILVNGSSAPAAFPSPTAATLTWSDQPTLVQETGCTVRGSDGSNYVYTQRTQSITPTAASTTYTISCPNISNTTQYFNSTVTVTVTNPTNANGVIGAVGAPVIIASGVSSTNGYQINWAVTSNTVATCNCNVPGLAGCQATSVTGQQQISVLVPSNYTSVSMTCSNSLGSNIKTCTMGSSLVGAIGSVIGTIISMPSIGTVAGGLSGGGVSCP